MKGEATRQNIQKQVLNVKGMMKVRSRRMI